MNSHNLPIDEMLCHLQGKLKNDIEEIKKEMAFIPELEKKCEKLSVVFKSDLFY